MPKKWKKYKLFDFMDINPRMKFDSGKQYSFVEMKDLDPTSRKVLPSNYKTLKGGAKFQNGDTLFARITPCLENGKICQVQGLKDNIGFGSTEFLVFRGKENVSDSDFVYYLSRDPFVKQFAEQNMIGTSGRQRVAKEAFINLEINLPPLPEQKAIAQILSAIDDKIENNLAINRTLEDMAMALYKHWFVDFRPFQDGEFVDSELGAIPKGWEVKRLTEISINHNKKRKPISTRERAKIQGKYPYYGATKILDYINEYKFDGEYILLAEDGTVKTDRDTPFLQFIEGQFWVSNHAHVLTGNEFYSNEFLYLSLSNTNVTPIITGAVQLKINKNNLESLEFVVPPNNQLKEFENIIIPKFKKIKELELENETLTKFRDTLLPRLISGEVRLKEFREEIQTVL